jgi:hypothetical protein
MRRRSLLVLFLVLLVLAVAALVALYLDDPHGETLTQLRTGMTFEVVEAVMGKPFTVSKGKSNDGPWKIYLGSWKVEHGFINVDFDANELVRSRRFRHERGSILQRLIPGNF